MTYPMFDPLIDGVLVLGPNKEVFYCNEACVTLFDLPRKKITSGTPSYELFTFDDPDLLLMADGTKGQDKRTPYREVHFKSASGKTGLVQVSILPSKEMFGRNKLWFVYFHDVTLEENLHKKYRFQLEEKQKTIEKLKDLQTKPENFRLQLVKELHEPLQLLEKKISSINDKEALTSSDLKSLRPLLETLKTTADQILATSKN